MSLKSLACIFTSPCNKVDHELAIVFNCNSSIFLFTVHSLANSVTRLQLTSAPSIQPIFLSSILSQTYINIHPWLLLPSQPLDLTIPFFHTSTITPTPLHILLHLSNHIHRLDQDRCSLSDLDLIEILTTI
jgi:hypothetical protein